MDLPLKNSTPHAFFPYYVCFILPDFFFVLRVAVCFFLEEGGEGSRVGGRGIGHCIWFVSGVITLPYFFVAWGYVAEEEDFWVILQKGGV